METDKETQAFSSVLIRKRFMAKRTHQREVYCEQWREVGENKTFPGEKSQQI